MSSELLPTGERYQEVEAPLYPAGVTESAVPTFREVQAAGDRNGVLLPMELQLNALQNDQKRERETKKVDAPTGHSTHDAGELPLLPTELNAG